MLVLTHSFIHAHPHYHWYRLDPPLCMGNNPSTPEAMDFVKSTIGAHKVVVFSKTYCPYASKAKRTLQMEGAQFHVVELDQRSDGAAIQAALADITGRRTVPNVFLDGKTIGGGDDTEALARTGQLRQMLTTLGARKEGKESESAARL